MKTYPCPDCHATGSNLSFANGQTEICLTCAGTGRAMSWRRLLFVMLTGVYAGEIILTAWSFVVWDIPIHPAVPLAVGGFMMLFWYWGLEFTQGRPKGVFRIGLKAERKTVAHIEPKD